MKFCSECCAPTKDDPCTICRDAARDRTTICVVERLTDLIAIEQAGGYRGLYHVLHGAIDPLGGIGPDQLRIKELYARLDESAVNEVILAMRPNTNGAATAMYLTRALERFGIRVTQRT